ncbi:hypothetical protein V2J23_09825 [Geobacillus thermoleovorans]|uniref:hypothetical protein n=1 Tax=Geobacillus thermoleovorans TaxID=33941 RepID=UPI00345B5506
MKYQGKLHKHVKKIRGKKREESFVLPFSFSKNEKKSCLVGGKKRKKSEKNIEKIGGGRTSLFQIGRNGDVRMRVGAGWGGRCLLGIYGETQIICYSLR